MSELPGRTTVFHTVAPASLIRELIGTPNGGSTIPISNGGPIIGRPHVFHIQMFVEDYSEDGVCR